VQKLFGYRGWQGKTTAGRLKIALQLKIEQFIIRRNFLKLAWLLQELLL
jgi:hypothetical protein